jgi:CBS domain containing-hemolysin-like protein
LRLTRRQRISHVPIRAEGPAGAWIGYVRTTDLAVSGGRLDDHTHALVEISATQSCLQALLDLFHQGEELGLVTSADGKTLGIVLRRRLCEALFRTPG